ncbi:MAG: disulfide bond formation protein B [Chlamydiales bacterium]|nr:disulfide bond formation protein B [Chlamydiales bacterium]
MLYLAWLLSLIGTLGSLYVSQIMGYEPCHLCWFQRICLFPLAIILGFACWDRFKGIARYIVWLPILGFFLALCQTLMQEIPAIESMPLCGGGQDCEVPAFTFFGWLTFPMLSLANFTLISLLLIFYVKYRPKSD